ncbi:hypothetical protein GCM10017744_079490 [Streptomyces antimycoticus]
MSRCPPSEDAFEASTGRLQAVIDAYVVVFAGLLITAGVVSDRYGRRRTVVAGLLVFGVASALAAAAPSVEWLIAMRALMGVGAALVMPATLAVLVAVFPEKERPRAFAVWSAVASVGMAAGPLLGGALVDVWSWAGVFLINVPVVTVALVGIVRLVPETRAGDGRGLDLLGTVLVTAGMTGLVWALIEAPAYGYTSPAVLGGALVAVVALVAFGVRQTRSAVPMVDLRLYRDRRFSGASFAVAVMTVATGSTLFILSQYLQLVLGYSAFETGLAAIPLAAGGRRGLHGGRPGTGQVRAAGLHRGGIRRHRGWFRGAGLAVRGQRLRGGVRRAGAGRCGLRRRGAVGHQHRAGRGAAGAGRYGLRAQRHPSAARHRAGGWPVWAVCSPPPTGATCRTDCPITRCPRLGRRCRTRRTMRAEVPWPSRPVRPSPTPSPSP